MAIRWIRVAVLTCTIPLVAPATGAEAPLPVDGSAEIWGVLLDILKAVGLLTTTAAGLISVITETKTVDKRLTRAGRSLLVLGVLGAVLALSSQGVEWVKLAYEQQATRLRNASVLNEIQRAVTRFEHFGLSVELIPPRNQPPFVNYTSVVSPQIEDFIDADPAVLEVINGMTVVTRDALHISFLRASSDSPIFPNEKEHGLVGTYIKQIDPIIALFKKPVDPRKYLDQGGDPDLLLYTSKGRWSAMFRIGEDDNKPSLVELTRDGMEISIYNDSSGQITSTRDLEGSQVILCLSKSIWRNDPLKNMLNKTKVYGVEIYVDYRKFSFDTADMKLVTSDDCPLAYTWTFSSISGRH